ncbi:unnamed protein product [Orchesella dallaii]|uniref:Uncharacterized protein n=1 Tax=Orchesella dallaii TaxID=48710 RepID=A0ABP1QNF0_9HEXA
MMADDKKDNVYRTWLRYFGAADICIFPLALGIITFYMLQARTHLNLWQEGPSDGTIEWVVSKTRKYESILYYTGNLENETSRAAQLLGMYSDMNERCGTFTVDITKIIKWSFVDILVLINLVSHALTLVVGAFIYYTTRNQSDASVSSIRLILGVVILILLMETVSCYLVKGRSLCPIMSLANLVFIQATLFIILYRISHIIAVHKYLQITAMSEYERIRIENKEARKSYEFSTTTILAPDESPKSHLEVFVHDTATNLSDSSQSNIEHETIGKQVDTYSSISSESPPINPVATKKNEINLAMKLDLTKELQEDESSITDDEYEEGSNTSTGASAHTTSGATFNSSKENIETTLNTQDYATMASAIDDTISADGALRDKRPSSLINLTTTPVDDIALPQGSIVIESDVPRPPPPTLDYDANADLSVQENVVRTSTPPQTPDTLQNNMNNLSKQSAANLTDYKSGVSLFERTSEITPGKTAAHFTIIRPKTRRNGDEQAKADVPHISTVINSPRNPKNRKVSFSGDQERRKKSQRPGINAVNKDGKETK